MSVTLVLGGSRSGKSRYAENLLRGYPTVKYVAPGAVPDDFDPEWAERISLHQARRPANWSTVETAELADVIRAADHPVLIDALSTWLTHLIDDIDAWADHRVAASRVEEETARLLEALGSAMVDVVLVTDEVGLSVVPSTSSGRMFRDELGRVIAAGQRPRPLEGGAFALPRTATVLIAGTPPTFAALRWSASSWRSHRSPSSLPRLHGEDLRQALHAGCADDGVLRRIFLAVGVAVVGVVDDQTAVGFDVGDDASRRPTRERLPTPRIPNRWPVCSARGKRAGLCACSSTALGFGECD